MRILYSKVALKVKSPLIIYGLPIPKRNNPVISYSIDPQFKTMVEGSSKLTVKIPIKTLGREASRWLKEVLKEVVEALSLALSKRLNIKIATMGSPKSSPYQYLSVQMLALMMFTRENIYPITLKEFLDVTSEAYSLSPEYRTIIESYIITLALNEPVVYRRGEGYIRLKEDVFKTLRLDFRWVNVGARFIEELPMLNELTLLLGRLVVEAASSTFKGDIKKLRMLHRIESYLSRTLYVAEEGTCKIVPETYGYVCIRVDGDVNV